MSHFPLHTPESAPEAARAKLKAGKDRFGFVPNLYAHLAEAPAALDAYFDLSAQFEKNGVGTEAKPARRVLRLIERTIDKHGNPLLLPGNKPARRRTRHGRRVGTVRAPAPQPRCRSRRRRRPWRSA